MRKTFEEIIADFDAHLKKSCRRHYSDFYVGITNDVDRRLFKEHNVSKDFSWWIYRTADDKETAQAVEKYYLDLGMKGDTGGGTDDSIVVYCYQITNSTIE